MTDRVSVIVLGIEIGTSESWEDLEAFACLFYKFKSIDGSLKEGDLFLNYGLEHAQISNGTKDIQDFSLLDYINKVRNIS